jgi:hypothetical protein
MDLNVRSIDEERRDESNDSIDKGYYRSKKWRREVLNLGVYSTSGENIE